MAELEDGEVSNSVPVVSDSEDVFVNGDTSEQRKDNLLHPDYSPDIPEGQVQPLPRRSSLVKDTSRRQNRKKTVSFSSMPGERIVINGQL